MIGDSSRAALSHFLAPMTVGTFVTSAWNTRALHIPGKRDKWSGLYDLKSWKKRQHVVDVRAAFSDAQGMQQESSIDIAKIPKALAAGHTVCADVSSEPNLLQFLKTFRDAFVIPGNQQCFAKLYAAPPGKGFALHFDCVHVFVAQLSGRRRWHFSPTPTIPNPRGPGCVNAANVPIDAVAPNRVLLDDDGKPLPPVDRGALDVVELDPGDLLYLPQGTWHAAEAIGDSIAISISPPRVEAIDVMMHYLRSALSPAPLARRDVVTWSESQPVVGDVPDTTHAVFTQLSQAIASAVAPGGREHIARGWLQLAEQGRPPTIDRPQHSASAAVQKSDRLTAWHNGPFRFVRAPSSDGCDHSLYFYCGSEEFSLPAAALPLVRGFAQNEAFFAGDVLRWDTLLNWPQARQLLTELRDAGVLWQL